MCYYNIAINWHMPLLVNLDNYSYLQLLSFVGSKLPISDHLTVCTRWPWPALLCRLWESSLSWFVWNAAGYCGASNWNKIAVSGSDQVHRNSYDMIIQKYLVSKHLNKIQDSQKTQSYSYKLAAKQVMVRWLRHKFREIFCTNNCFIFRETACLTFVKQNLDNENHFFVSSLSALRHTKQQQMVFSFESWRFLYLFFSKVYLNTTVENMNILWIDLTTNKETSPLTFVGNRCQIWPHCQTLLSIYNI